MPVENPPNLGPQADDTALAARRLLRSALKGSLATLDRETGHPYASLVLVATEPDATPLFLISRLALHTRNLEKDPRASLLLDGTDGLGDPLTGSRMTLMGLARPSRSATARRRYLARHPGAEGYAGFADFAMYALEFERAHVIGGFGRISDIGRGALLTDVADAAALIAAEPDIIAHMNSDHAEAVALYATVLGNAPTGNWRMCGVDPDGVDLLQRTNAVRIDFDAPVRTPGDVRKTLVALAQKARDAQQQTRH